jgi:hypothetical protein
MKIRTLLMSLLLAALGANAYSETPSNAPAGTTGVCNDGTFSNAASKAGACSGHKGVKSWTGPATAVITPEKTVPTAPAVKAATPAAVPASAPAASTKSMAAGAGPDKVWVNAASKVYHCPGTRYYGTTKKGSYMTEAEATAAGNRADHKKVCFK